MHIRWSKTYVGSSRSASDHLSQTQFGHMDQRSYCEKAAISERRRPERLAMERPSR
jgi:hypothetical protein